MLPPSSLYSNLASGALAVAKDVGRDRFVGDSCPRNSRKRRVTRAQLPCCPRLRGMIPDRSETAQIAIRDFKDSPSRGVIQVIGPRIPRNWLAHWDEENLDGVDNEIVSWMSQDLLKTCASTLPVSGLDHCQIGITPIVLGDVNAVLHARMSSSQTIVPYARSESTIFVDQSALLPAQRRLGSYALMTSSFAAPGNLSTGRIESRPLRCSVPRFSRRCCRCKSDAAASLGKVGTRPLFSTKKVFTSLDVPYYAAATLPPTRRCQVSRSLLDELLLVMVAALLLHTNLRAEACEKLHATDASSRGAGSYFTPVTQEACLALYALSKEKGEYARIGRKSERPPSNIHDGRATAAPLALELNWATMISYRFFEAIQINPLEVESPISLLKGVTHEGI